MTTTQVVEALANAVMQTDGCRLLDVDPGPSTNRTVFTFVGSPDDVVEGALNMSRVAFSLIDMTRHKGEHPRMGALDVCPFVPVANVTMEECSECANKFGSRLAEELNVPVYLYGHAAVNDARFKLPDIRTGEYEALPEKLQQDKWKPDYGPAAFVPSWGATATGSRTFLIAFNVNILGTKEQAHRIALNLRTQGRGKDQPGRLQQVQGIGWWLEEANMAQVSFNLTDPDVTSMHVAYEECLKDAKEVNVGVCGSQVVGIIPLKAILSAAEYYIQRDNLFILEESQKVRLAINRLGLSSVSQFNPKDRIIEYMIEDESEANTLTSLSLRSFIRNIGARTPTPGGGSASAAIGAMGAALCTMVGWMTYGNKKFMALDGTMRKLIPPLYEAMNALIPLVDADADAFNAFMSAMKLPKTSDEDKEKRDIALLSTTKASIAVPMHTAITANKCWEPMKELAVHGNVQCISDLQVGARALETAVWGAYYNVMINLPNMTDDAFKTKAKSDIDEALKQAQDGAAAVLKIIDDRVNKG
ncbi:formimidoyltransferase-cyclodeaminase-like isoform X2 [Anneissia japonica]|uniref:formimidoyltransferase-cyclodeaminase-like isoform X2 n=1 Tax=Anneissia japonica TaxID=1529436 RepID=UPI0014255113|nr:formimidoyltransferase-cyclodeaminase-like isoform X2 [Anneissia japonica]